MLPARVCVSRKLVTSWELESTDSQIRNTGAFRCQDFNSRWAPPKSCSIFHYSQGTVKLGVLATKPAQLEKREVGWLDKDIKNLFFFPE